MEKKYIKVVTYDNFPFGGAPANFVRYFSLSLSLVDNNDVEVILPTGNYGNKSNINKQRVDEIESLKYRHLAFIKHPENLIGKFLDVTLGSILPLFYFIKQKLDKKVDTIIIYNTRFTITLLFLFIKWLTATKLIIILPEYYEKPKSKYFLQKLNWLNFYFGIEYLVKKADKFVVLSTFMSNFLIKKNIKKENIFLLPNIIDPEIFNLKDVPPFKENKITIGYSGTPTSKDGINDLLESFALLTKKFSNIHLLVIGDYPNGGSLIPNLTAKCISMGIIDNVTFTGMVSFTEVPILLNSCQILALTRPAGVFAEAGFPTKLGEYFACRKPVLVTAVGDIKNYFQNGVHAIIVDPGNINSIVKGFDNLLSDESLRNIISVNGFNWANEQLNFKYLALKMSSFN